jgi:hypothetical protein
MAKEDGNIVRNVGRTTDKAVAAKFDTLGPFWRPESSLKETYMYVYALGGYRLPASQQQGAGALQVFVCRVSIGGTPLLETAALVG